MSTLHCTRSPIRILREPLRRIGFWTDQSLEYQSQLFTFVDHSSISNAKLLEKAWVTEVTKSLMWQLQISRNHIQLLAVVFSKNWGAAIKWSTYLELPSYETSLMSWSPSTPIRSHSLIVQSSSPFCCSVFFEKWLWWVTSKLKFWSKKKRLSFFISFLALLLLSHHYFTYNCWLDGLRLLHWLPRIVKYLLLVLWIQFARESVFGTREVSPTLLNFLRQNRSNPIRVYSKNEGTFRATFSRESIICQYSWKYSNLLEQCET